MATFDPLFGAIGVDSWFPSPTHVLRRAAILDVFGSFPGGKLLEMGCGAGRMLVDWNRLGHRGQAVDLDEEARGMAAQCARTFDTHFEIGEKPTEFDFDYLVATEVLEHIEDPGLALRDWASHLKSNGILLCTVPAFSRYWGRSDEWAGHVQRFEPEQFRTLVTDAGFDILDLRLYGYPLGNALRIAGNLTSGMKMRTRKKVLTRQEATQASGRDRSIERKLAPIMQAFPARLALKAAIALQRQANRGQGLIVVARKQGAIESSSLCH